MTKDGKSEWLRLTGNHLYRDRRWRKRKSQPTMTLVAVSGVLIRITAGCCSGFVLGVVTTNTTETKSGLLLPSLLLVKGGTDE